MKQSGPDCLRFGQHAFTTPGGTQVFECIKHGKISLSACHGCTDFDPLEFPDLEWAVGITTVPERTPMALRFSQHLEAAGFKTPRLSIDHTRTRGPFGNFYVLASTLYIDQPAASGYLMLQDDIEIAPDAKTILDQAGHFLADWAALSLYTAPEIGNPGPPDGRMPLGWWQVNRGWDSPGACAYLFSDWAMRDLLTDPVVLAHRRLGGGHRALDSVIGVWASKFGGIWHYARYQNELATHRGLPRVPSFRRLDDAGLDEQYVGGA